MSNATPEPRRKPRVLAHLLVESFTDRIRDGRIAVGQKLPTEAAIMSEFDVSRTVVREALSKLQAAGLVETRHGIGSFAIGHDEAVPFCIAPEQLATLHDVLALLELRIGLETEAASLAARRRSPENLRSMRTALDEFMVAVSAGADAVAADFKFHLELARASHNVHFSDLLTTLGARVIPRARLEASVESGALKSTASKGQGYLLRVNDEHESILDAVERQDSEAARAAMRTHLVNSHERRRRAAPFGDQKFPV